jgi:hypothetical protein
MSLVFGPGNVEFVVRVAQDQQFSFDRLSVPLGTNGQPAMFDCLNVALGNLGLRHMAHILLANNEGVPKQRLRRSTRSAWQ